MHFSMHDTIFNFLHRILFIQKNWNRLLYFLRSQLRQSFFRDMARMIFFKIIFFRKRKRRKKTNKHKKLRRSNNIFQLSYKNSELYIKPNIYTLTSWKQGRKKSKFSIPHGVIHLSHFVRQKKLWSITSPPKRGGNPLQRLPHDGGRMLTN